LSLNLVGRLIVASFIYGRQTSLKAAWSGHITNSRDANDYIYKTHQEMRQRTRTFLRWYRTRTSQYQKENLLRLAN